MQSALPSYRLERELGRGGMATVFLAQDLKHKRPVALKVLHPELAHALGPERFHREVELAARLQHPHILTVLDSGEAGGHLWFTMPFVDGESLRDRLTRVRQLPLEEALRIGSEAARALDYAHRHGIIHRDVKPENILITGDGDTLVADFGIARALSSNTGEHLTETGVAVGTPAYMSPEQATGERQLDPRSDVYALGAVVFEMLAGEPPFTGATAQAVIAKRFQGEVPSVRAVRPSVPVQIEAAITKALAPVAADRFATAADFAKALGVATTSTVTAARPSAPIARPAEASRKRRIPAGFAFLVVGFLIGVGALFAWKRGGHTGTPGSRVIAVLPFDNQGDSTQEYFADGITDAVRGKLSALSGVQVIAGASSKPYRHSEKPLAQVAGELGADYLLMAKVRWAKNPDGTAQVQVTPELIEISSGKPTTKWQQAFDGNLTNVFKVQADIAGQVAGALNVALADSVSQKLGNRPTANLPAYDAFLRGEQLFVTLGATDPVTLRRAVTYYQQAVGLDSNFTLAWARIGRAEALLYSNGVPDPALAEASLRAINRALALEPNSPDGRLAYAGYFRDITGEMAKAREQCELVLRVEPQNATALGSIAVLDAIVGQWDSALVHAQLATRLDPLSVTSALRLGSTLRKLGRYDESRRELDRGLARNPGVLALIESRVMVELRDGKLDSARTVVRAAMHQTEPAALVAYLANYWDLFWVLDEPQQQLLLSLTPADFDGDRSTWAIVMAQTFWMRGEKGRLKSFAESAVVATREVLKTAPNDPQRLIFLGLSQAYLGQKAEAIRNAERGAGMVLPSQDAITGAYYQHLLARIYVLCGENDKAVDILEKLLKNPYDISPGWLRIDPNFAPLKESPRFEKLIAGRT